MCGLCYFFVCRVRYAAYRSFYIASKIIWNIKRGIHFNLLSSLTFCRSLAILIGIAQQLRRCLEPKKGCRGESGRYRICNMQVKKTKHTHRIYITKIFYKFEMVFISGGVCVFVSPFSWCTYFACILLYSCSLNSNLSHSFSSLCCSRWALTLVGAVFLLLLLLFFYFVFHTNRFHKSFIHTKCQITHSDTGIECWIWSAVVEKKAPRN